MMKGVLVFIVVLAMTLTASAGFVPTLGILVNGNPWTGGDVKPSDIITVTYLDEGDTTAPGSFAQFALIVSNGDYEPDSWVYNLPPGLLGGVLELTAPYEQGLKVAGTALFAPTVEKPTPLFLFQFHVPEHKQASDYIYIDLSGAYGGIDVSSLSTAIHVMPEPMTMALLGLGGLLALRRRK